MKKKTTASKTTKSPAKKSVRSRSRAKVKSEIADLTSFDTPESLTPEMAYQPTSEKTSRSLIPSTRVLSLGVLVVALIVLFATNRGFFLAAMVDGQPVFRWTLNDVLTKRYGSQTLEGIVTEKLIANEASKQSITVNPADIQTREKEILSSFGSNLTVDDFLRLQGINKTDFENQLKLQIMVQRILTKDLTISDSDITNFIATNSTTLTATDPAKLKEEARQAIIDSKVGEQIDSFLQMLRSKASIQKFL